jgi:anti-sigma B factor antagonist
VVQDFDISDESRDGASIVSVHGEVDVATAPMLRDRLNLVIDRDQGIVVVDLLGVTFIDSTGLGVLIGALQRSGDDARELRIVAAEPRILKVFEITGLTGLFSIHASADDAISA